VQKGGFIAALFMLSQLTVPLNSARWLLVRLLLQGEQEQKLPLRSFLFSIRSLHLLSHVVLRICVLPWIFLRFQRERSLSSLRQVGGNGTQRGAHSALTYHRTHILRQQRPQTAYAHWQTIERWYR
jgi:hypothetical protein